MKNTLSSLLLIVVVIIACFLYGNNKFVNLQEDVMLQQAQVETTLQRRNDLIPNLVETVKGYVKHEEAVFTEIADARSALAGSIEVKDLDGIEKYSEQLDNALNRLLVISESYPELKANEQFIALQDELAGTENRINVARQYYNEAVMKYNKAVRNFPGSMIAKICGHEPIDYFEADEDAKEAPIVSFS